MIPNPIAKALSSISIHRVRGLLMGGQACVLYGGAEFSRDVDFVLAPDAETLNRLRECLADLRAEPIAVPPFEPQHLAAGLAVHFRCRHPEADGLRLDVMTVLRGVDAFDDLWERRTTATIESGDGEPLAVELLGLPDLVRAKKTQQDKDWPMIARLIEADYDSHPDPPSPERLAFWLAEARTPAVLFDLTARFPEAAAASPRPAVAVAFAGDEEALRRSLRDEEDREKAIDRAYWRPLRLTLEQLRRERPRT